MKRLLAPLLAVIALTAGAVAPAAADDYFHWPEFGFFETNSDWAAKAVRAPEAHALGATGSGVKVAFLDDGISASTQGLSNKVIAYKDFLPGHYFRPEHGTMVASTIASDYEPAVGIRGIAPGVSLIVGRVCQNSTCDNTAIRKALAWAVEEGAQIVSMSFTGFSDPAMLATLKAAKLKGVVVVTSMGNSGCGPYSSWGLNPYCLQGKIHESTQGGYPIAGLIAVGASDQRGARVATLGWSSSYGPNMDLLAPGTDTTAYDSVAASNGFGGTSSAAPIVAGVAALVLQANPNLKPDQVQAILQATASAAVEEKAKVWDNCTYDAETKNWSCNQIVDSQWPQQYFTGAGVVNAEAAVQLARKSITGDLIEPVSLNQEDLTLSITWQGGPADLYVNSKLIASNTLSGYQYQGFANQSVAVQIKRKQGQSLPALAVMNSNVLVQKPVINRPFVDSDLQLRFEVPGLEAQADKVWRKQSPGSSYVEYAGIFELDDGQILGCFANNHLSDVANFFCPLPDQRALIAGKLRLISSSTDLSEPSDSLVIQNPYQTPPIILTTTYLANGLPKFDWDDVAGASSYRYRYENQYILHCMLASEFTIPEPPNQPSVFFVEAFPTPDCSGNRLATSESITWVAQPAKPAKLTGITVKSIWYQNVEFEIANLDPTLQLRVYRSDGLMLRIFQGQPVIVGMQANEDVNGKVFSYRFMQIAQSSWAQTWGDLSDPITVTLPNLAKPSAQCSQMQARFSIRCDIKTVPGAPRTRVEYLDSDKKVLASQEFDNFQQGLLIKKRAPRATTFVRVAATIGDEKTRHSWYRRGESQLIEISQLKRVDGLAQAQ